MNINNIYRKYVLLLSNNNNNKCMFFLFNDYSLYLLKNWFWDICTYKKKYIYCSNCIKKECKHPPFILWDHEACPTEENLGACRLRMAAVMCWGLLKILCIKCVYVFASSLLVASLTPGLVQSGFPGQHTLQITVSRLPVFQFLRHAACDGDPVTDSQMTLFFQSPFINTAPRAFLTTNQCVSGAGQRSEEAHALYNCMTTCNKKLRTP